MLWMSSDYGPTKLSATATRLWSSRGQWLPVVGSREAREKHKNPVVENAHARRFKSEGRGLKSWSGLIIFLLESTLNFTCKSSRNEIITIIRVICKCESLSHVRTHRIRNVPPAASL